ncbi:hypothetical protein ACRQGG_08410 [Actinotignum sp. GS-2025b]|uniref:hypothetical protein n=1 Tax=Actinotignum sp. GS-2025b TaxID=3427275 RepID=UPI003F46CF9D
MDGLGAGEFFGAVRDEIGEGDGAAGLAHQPGHQGCDNHPARRQHGEQRPRQGQAPVHQRGQGTHHHQRDLDEPPVHRQRGEGIDRHAHQPGGQHQQQRERGEARGGGNGAESRGDIAGNHLVGGFSGHHAGGGDGGRHHEREHRGSRQRHRTHEGGVRERRPALNTAREEYHRQAHAGGRAHVLGHPQEG